MSIYQKAKEIGIEIDSHETDLYLKDCQESRKLIEEYEFKNNVTKFRSQIDKCLWFDVPFAYDPAWEKRQKV